MIAVVTLALSACGGSSCTPENDDPDNDDRPGLIVDGLAAADDVSPWLMVIDLFRRESVTLGSGDGSIYMRRYRDDFPISQHVDFYSPELDTCEIRDQGSTGGGGSPPSRINVGATIDINTASGSWFTFVQSLDDNGKPIYRTNIGLPGALPGDATVSLPAADYPALSAYQLDEPVAPLRLLPDADEPLTRDAVYSWIPGDPKGFIEIAFLAYDANNDFQGFKVGCDVVDDGSFSMPEDVLNFIDASPDRLEVRYARTIKRVDIINGIVIHQNSEVAE